jgi:hypothetical protein
MLTDTSVKLLSAIGVALHLGAPLLGWFIGSMRWPVAAVVIVSGVVTLGLMVLERPHLEWLPVLIASIQLLAIGGGIWWLVAAAPPAVVLTWIGYGLGLLFLASVLAFMLLFKMDRLW